MHWVWHTLSEHVKGCGWTAQLCRGSPGVHACHVLETFLTSVPLSHCPAIQSCENSPHFLYPGVQRKGDFSAEMGGREQVKRQEIQHSNFQLKKKMVKMSKLRKSTTYILICKSNKFMFGACKKMHILDEDNFQDLRPLSYTVMILQSVPLTLEDAFLSLLFWTLCLQDQSPSHSRPSNVLSLQVSLQNQLW